MSVCLGARIWSIAAPAFKRCSRTLRWPRVMRVPTGASAAVASLHMSHTPAAPTESPAASSSMSGAADSQGSHAGLVARQNTSPTKGHYRCRHQRSGNGGRGLTRGISLPPLPRPSRRDHGGPSGGGGGVRESTSDVQQQQQQVLHERSVHTGIFQSCHVKPFPVRAAIDIGTGGVMSLSIARVDAEVGALQKLLYQTQLPLYLEAMPTGREASPMTAAASSSSPFILDERSINDIVNKMRILHGVMRRSSFEGLSERAAVLSWPVCLARDAPQLAARLSREFKMDVRVLGVDFNFEWPSSALAAVHAHREGAARGAKVTMPTEQPHVKRGMVGRRKGRAASHRLKMLLQRSADVAPAAAAEHQHPSSAEVAGAPRQQLEALAFLAHAAVSQCVAPHRLVVVDEHPQRGVRLIGMGTSATEDVADLYESAATPEERQKLMEIAFGKDAEMSSVLPVGAAPEPPDGTMSAAPSVKAVVHSTDDPAASRRCLVTHDLPVDVATAHRYCITQVQRRPIASYDLHGSSPNPLLADEFCTLRGLLTDALQSALPAWVRRKLQLGGVLCGTSYNGGLLNTAARVSQQTHVSLEHLEVHAEHHFCGLTDVLLAESFPYPLLVLPSAALVAALLRALESPRLTYLPEVNVAAALLVQRGLWLHRRAAEVRRKLAEDPFYALATADQRGRTFERPHRKDNPTAAPSSTRTKMDRGNPLSYEQSMRGM